MQIGSNIQINSGIVIHDKIFTSNVQKRGKYAFLSLDISMIITYCIQLLGLRCIPRYICTDICDLRGCHRHWLHTAT